MGRIVGMCEGVWAVCGVGVWGPGCMEGVGAMELRQV